MQKKPKLRKERGLPLPLGTSFQKNGINFALFSENASEVSLCLFKPEEPLPFAEISLDSKKNKTGNIWHILIFGIPPHYHYGYRINGPYAPLSGHYFDNRHILLDPYAKDVTSPYQWDEETAESKHIHRSTISHQSCFDWEEDAPPRIPLKDLIIYEMHVRGFTQDPSSQVQHPGTFLGILEKIPYLKSLNVNAIELMPLFEFREKDSLGYNPKTGEKLYNYWGYSPLNFFSPMKRYGTGEQNTIDEFKQLVKALHAHDMEIILDVVFNHTGEGNQEGKIVSFKGIENSVYYNLGPNGEYYNFSGCGNTVNCNHPLVRELIRDALRYWVSEMHVDGFRFDLASILTRSHDGIPLHHPPLIEMLSEDPILKDAKLIAEPWDCGGLYQVGTFPAMHRWAEWNGKYRDDVRSFLKGTDGMVGAFATRLCGSEDLYGGGRLPSHSINFITAHDGFSLQDLVSYNDKHNEENGEENRDGTDHNCSWNCGKEGETKLSKVLALRNRQKRNFLLALLISQGVPLLLMGDEYGHTKYGNNNSWRQDSRLNWFLWDRIENEKGFLRFYRMMIALRQRYSLLRRTSFLKESDISWHGIYPKKPNWGQDSRFIAFSLFDPQHRYSLYIAFNAYHHSLTIHLPPVKKGTSWHRIVDTSLKTPEDIVEEEKASPLSSSTYQLSAYSSILLKWTL